MKKRYHEKYENDTTPSREIVERYRAVIYNDERDVDLALLHYRGGLGELQLGVEYCSSKDAGDRATGADILAQLGWSDKTFLDESVEILIKMLGDSDDYVIYCAAVALGHRGCRSAIPYLLKHMAHPNSLIRYGIVFGLLGHEDLRAIAALISLSTDEDRDVRNWAVFGLGTQVETDTLELREALKSALCDSDHEIRGEALVGLAKRKYPFIVEELINEWGDDDVSLLSIEAAEECGDPRLYDRLDHFDQIFDLEEDPFYEGYLKNAMLTCSPKVGENV